jgi:hypothetical protein
MSNDTLSTLLLFALIHIWDQHTKIKQLKRQLEVQR